MIKKEYERIPQDKTDDHKFPMTFQGVNSSTQVPYRTSKNCDLSIPLRNTFYSQLKKLPI